ncbi:MAG: hypothetical protein D6707_00145, partial [Bacteroidetes bacterium]
MKNIQVILGIFFCFSLSNGFAQNDTIQDLSQYFDDGKISNSKNIVKINATSIINGDLPVYYERPLTNSFSVELGAGLLLPYYFPEIFFPDETDYEPITNSNLGYSLWFFPKIYLFSPSEFSYVGFMYRRRAYQNEQTVIYNDFTISSGYQINPVKRLVLDIYLGVGIRFKTQESLDIKNESIGTIIPIG